MDHSEGGRSKTLTAGLTGTVTKTYDGNTGAVLTAGNYTLTGIVNGDAVTTGKTTGTYDNKNAGTAKVVSVTGLTLSGAGAGNYILASADVSGAVGTITQATLTAGLTGTTSKTYDGTTTATLGGGNYTLTGIVSGDSVTLNNPAAGSYDTKDSGTGKTVSVSGLTISGAEADNYALASVTISGAIGIIDKAPLTVIIGNGDRYVGQTNPDVTATVTGFVAPDNVSVLSGLTVTTLATTGSPPGAYAITALGGTAQNYFIATRIDGTLTVIAGSAIPGYDEALMQPAEDDSTNPRSGNDALDGLGLGNTLLCQVSSPFGACQAAASLEVPAKTAARTPVRPPVPAAGLSFLPLQKLLQRWR